MCPRKATQSILKLVLDIGPLVLFFAANAKFGIFAATGAFMVAVLIALARSLRHDAARRGDAAGHRSDRASVRRADVGAARRDFHQAQADHHLLPVRRYAARRPCLGKSLLGILFDQMFQLTEEGWRKLTCAGRCSSSRWRCSTRSSGERRRRISGSASNCSACVPLTFLFGALQMPLIKKYSRGAETIDAWTSTAHLEIDLSLIYAESRTHLS